MFNTITRRAFARMSAAAAATALPGGISLAQEQYPSRPVTIVEGFAPGGGSDIVVRFLAQKLQADFGQPVVVENRPGASGTVATAGLIRARPDGYTVMLGSISTTVVVPQAMATPPYDSLRDLTPIMIAARVPQVLVVPATSPFRTFGDFVAYARANPEKLNYASSGVAAAQHTAAELFSRAAGIRMTHVPYRGSGQSITALIAAQVDLNFDTLPTNLPHIREGRLRALAVTTPRRVEWLPDVPTIAEQGFPDYERTVWYMLVGPAGLPEPIVSRWVTSLNKIMEAPDTKAYLRDRGFILGGGTAADAARLLREETERTRILLREADIRLD